MTTQIPTDRFAAQAALLDAELPDRRFVDGRYLRWLYTENPLGPGIWTHAVERDADGAPVVAAHYGLTPMTYRNHRGPAPFVFSLNACTRRGAQRRGWFSTLGEELYARAAEAGKWGVIGVTNDKSTKPVVTTLRFRLMGSLPVVVAMPTATGSGVASWPVDDALLGSDRFAAVAEGVDAHPAWAWTNAYSPEFLRWRLASPNSGPYVFHVGADVVGVSVAERLGGLPVAVIVKLLPRDGRCGPLSAGPIVAAACRHHRAPFAVYAGFNRHVRVHGVRPPRRLLPKPLNLMYRSTNPDAPEHGFRLDTFEFLDMDAY